METIQFSSIRNDIMSSMKRHMLIPIIGSGFTRNCSSSRGSVPSGDDYRRYMIEAIIAHTAMSDDEINQLSRESFSSVSGIYRETVPQQERLSYLKNNFTHVVIEDYKKAFLAFDWPYVYTLNIDDGIERNSEYNTVVYSNRPVQKSIFDDNKCVIKLHGDIDEMLTYDDAVSEIFDQKQYVLSLQKNASLLSRLTHDFRYQNMLYVGCSLSDEIDLMSAANIENSIGNARYFCTIKAPSKLEEIRLKNYGITHCIVFDSYVDIYELLSDTAKEAQMIGFAEIDKYKSFSFSRLDADFEANRSYLFHGKSLINKDRTITIPYFFITREITASIVAKTTENSLQFVWGNSCSGKTYIAIDVALQIRDKDVFVFESKDTLSDIALNSLIDRGNCLIIADNGSLSVQQIEHLIRINDELHSKKIHIVIIANKNNRDLSGLIRLMELNRVIESNFFPETVIDNRLTHAETGQLNSLLVESALGVFSENKTIVDNIIEASKALLLKNKFSNIVPHFSDERMVACLIALAIEQKVYSSQMVEYDFANELYCQQRATEPLVEQETTWDFEMTASNNSVLKYVVNAEYWLNEQLDSFAKRPRNQSLIIAAFRYIISRIVLIYGKPDLMQGEKYSQYKPYILFDNINRIFKTQGFVLARGIYENLNDLLANDPNYMHQRSKCLIKSTKIEKDPDEKVKMLEKAYRDASVAYSVFTNRFEESKNDRILISIAHVEYTMALILCHLCKTCHYVKRDTNTKAVSLLHNALLSPYNSYDYVKNDSYNYGNAISDLVSTLIADKSLVEDHVHMLLTELFKIISG